MFHPSERSAVIVALLRRRRDSLRSSGLQLSEAQIAAAAGRSQPTVNQWLNIDGPRGRLGRESFKDLVSKGLMFQFRECQALLWLADFRPLDVGEVVSLWGLGAANDFVELDECELESTILGLMDASLEGMDSAITVFSSEDERRRDFYRFVADVQEEDVPTMSVSVVPPFISLPRDLQIERYRRVGGEAAADSEMVTLIDRRYSAWETRAASNVIRTILSRYEISNYFQRAFSGHGELPEEESRRWLEHWVNVIECHPNYHLALTDPISTTYELVGLSSLLLTRLSPAHVSNPHGVHSFAHIFNSRGIHSLNLTDPKVIYKFRIEFERHWQSIPAQDSEKSNVLAWLRSLQNATPVPSS
jgi:hypothetical protein